MSLAQSDTRLPDLAQAIVDALNSEFATQLTARYHPAPVYELPDLSTLKVDVLPSTLSRPRHTRAGRAKEAGIDIYIQQQCPSVTRFDELTNLADDMVNYLPDRRYLNNLYYCDEAQFGDDETHDRQSKWELNLFQTVIRARLIAWP